jgi:hypothetical protein
MRWWVSSQPPESDDGHDSGGLEEVDESREHGAQPGGGELGGEGVAAGVGKAGDLGGLAAVDLDQGGVGQAFLGDDGECAAALA